MTDIASNNSWFSSTLKIIHIMQMLIQGQYLYASTLLTIPHITPNNLRNFEKEIEKKLYIEKSNMNLLSLKLASLQKRSLFESVLITSFDTHPTKDILQHFSDLPLLDLNISISNVEQKISKKNPRTVILESDVQYEFVFNIKRIGTPNLSVNAPRFPKKKEEGWFLCVGDAEHDYLIEIKRITVVKQSTCSFFITTPRPGKMSVSISFFF